jgi:hypothetical protein
MPGSFSFGLNKNLDISNVITNLPTYKVVQTEGPIFDLSTNVVIGKLVGTKNITKDTSGNVVLAVYNYIGTFIPVTDVSGIFSFSIAYNANQLAPNGETEITGAFGGNIDISVSSGTFSGQEGKTLKVKDSSDIRKYYIDYPYGYSNIISNVQCPTALNAKEYVTLSSADTPSWVIGSDPKELVCVEAGKWNILTQYQMISTQNGLGVLNGWFNLNGVDVPDSDAEGTTLGPNNHNVLAIGLSKYFNVGDKVKFGISSSNTDGATTLRAICKTTTGSPSGLSTPAVIITAARCY